MAIKIYSEGGETILDDGIEIVVSSFFYYTSGDTISIIDSNTKKNAWNVNYSEIQDKSGSSVGGTLQEVIEYLSTSVEGAIPSEFIFVDSVSDLPTASSGVITLADNLTYYFTSHIDLLGKRLICGANTTILGASSENCSITSTGIGTSFPTNYLIESLYTLPIRHITIKNVPLGVGINISGTGVQPIALDWTGVNFSGCSINMTFGDIDNFIFSKGAILGGGKTIFEGSVGTIGIDNSIFVGGGGAESLIELTASCTVTRRFRIIYSSIVAFASTDGIDVNASATIPTEGFILDTVNFSGGSTYLAGLDNTSNKALFIRCVGIVNTSVNGQMYMQGNATATTISDTTNFFKVAGTTTASSDNEKYTETDNRLTNGASIERKYLIQCSLSFESGNNNICEFGFYDSKLSSVRTPSRTKSTANSAGRAESITFSCVVQHSDGDYIEIHAKNTTGTNDITVTDMNVVITEFV